MRVDKKFKGLQDTHDPLYPVYLIRGYDDPDRQGHIKTEYIAPHKAPHIVRCEWDVNAHTQRRERLKDIRVHHSFYDKGWRLVEEEYMKEGRQHDWEQFKEFQAACRNGRVRIREILESSTPEKRKELANSPCPGFPTDMLPTYAQELCKGEVGPATRWQPVRENEVNGDEKAELASELPADSGSGDRGAAKAAKAGRRPQPRDSGQATP